jgi:hypothetical protein
MRLLAFLCGFCQVSTAMLPYTTKLLGEPSELCRAKNGGILSQTQLGVKKKRTETEQKKRARMDQIQVKVGASVAFSACFRTEWRLRRSNPTPGGAPGARPSVRER